MPIDPEDGAAQHVAGLAAESYGDSDDRPPLVLLHGLTFDRTMWRPALNELRKIDPGRRALAIDLPGHGGSREHSSYDLERVVRAVHDAAEETRLRSPVLVGHSMGAIIASIYAATYPTRGVINVDQPLQIAPFARLVQSMADKLRGPDFPAVWDMFEASFHTELLPPSAQDLVRSTSDPRQDLVLGYWQEVLDRPPEALAERTATGLSAVRASGVPYLIVAGDELEPEYQAWLDDVLPQAVVTVWPRSGHFPHLAHPDLFAQCLATTAQWRDDPTGIQA